MDHVDPAMEHESPEVAHETDRDDGLPVATGAGIDVGSNSYGRLEARLEDIVEAEGLDAELLIGFILNDGLVDSGLKLHTPLRMRIA